MSVREFVLTVARMKFPSPGMWCRAFC